MQKTSSKKVSNFEIFLELAFSVLVIFSTSHHGKIDEY